MPETATAGAEGAAGPVVRGPLVPPPDPDGGGTLRPWWSGRATPDGAGLTAKWGRLLGLRASQGDVRGGG